MSENPYAPPSDGKCHECARLKSELWWASWKSYWLDWRDWVECGAYAVFIVYSLVCVSMVALLLLTLLTLAIASVMHAGLSVGAYILFTVFLALAFALGVVLGKQNSSSGQ